MAAKKNDTLPPEMKLFSPAALLSDPNYDPERLLSTVMKKLHLKNFAALGRALEVEAPIISKVRNKITPVSALLLIRMHEVSDLSIRDLRQLMFKGNRNLVRNALKQQYLG